MLYRKYSIYSYFKESFCGDGFVGILSQLKIYKIYIFVRLVILRKKIFLDTNECTRSTSW